MDRPHPDRDLLLQRAGELLGAEWLAANREMPLEQLISLLAEIEMSRDDWGTYDREVGESRPVERNGAAEKD